jgi:drug/metabolite transporter (DMT)-like permease
MWETTVAFAVWGAYGAVLAATGINPIVTAIARSVALGALLAPFAGARIPWRSRALWLSGIILLVDEVLYAVSAVSGPVAIIGLAYGCVPVVVPIVAGLIGTDRGGLTARRWVYLAIAFAGNLLIFSELHAAGIAFSAAALFAAFAALLFCVMPIASAELQRGGLGPWSVLGAQGAVAAIAAAPLTAALWGLGSFRAVDAHVLARSASVGAVNAVAFTMVPFYFWYRGIARAGVSRTAVCCFAEPLVATACSLVVLRDAPATPRLLAGVACVFAGIVLSVRGG